MRVANTLRTKWGKKIYSSLWRETIHLYQPFIFPEVFQCLCRAQAICPFFCWFSGGYTIIELGGGFILYFHLENWGRFPIWLAHIFQMGGSTTNQLYCPIGLMNISQLESYLEPKRPSRLRNCQWTNDRLFVGQSIYMNLPICNLPTSNQKTDTRSRVLKIFNLHLPSSPCQPLEAHEYQS